MPIYTYRCFKCGHPREIVLSIEDRDDTQTCACGLPMTRIMALPQKSKMYKSTRELCFESLNSPDSTVKPQHKKQMADGWTFEKSIY